MNSNTEKEFKELLELILHVSDYVCTYDTDIRKINKSKKIIKKTIKAIEKERCDIFDE